MKNFVIAIDGHSASGKGTLATRIAQHFRCKYLPTGNLYRVFAYLMFKNNINPIDLQRPEEVKKAFEKFDFFMLYSSKLIDSEIAKMASIVAKNQMVRSHMNEIQYQWIKDNKVAILEGRDIGTVIAPDADVKIFLIASPEERAKRRMLQYQLEGNSEHRYQEVLSNIKERDYQDSTRENAPMKMAKDAHLIDSSNLAAQQVYDDAMRIILKTYNQNH